MGSVQRERALGQELGSPPAGSVALGALLPCCPPVRPQQSCHQPGSETPEQLCKAEPQIGLLGATCARSVWGSCKGMQAGDAGCSNPSCSVQREGFSGDCWMPFPFLPQPCVHLSVLQQIPMFCTQRSCRTNLAFSPPSSLPITLPAPSVLLSAGLEHREGQPLSFPMHHKCHLVADSFAGTLPAARRKAETP